jgi:16S rRNA (cytosine1402-N4)-methyltransferase
MQAPTFYHTTVLLKEAVDGLNIQPDGVYVDATFGGGGHSKEILSRLGQRGKLFAFDHDADAWRNKPEDNRLVPVTENFRYLKRFLCLHGHPQVNGILADLGVSSWQFDTAERGFSTRFEGPLDMRMDNRSEKTAAQVLNAYSEQKLHRIFEQYGEVRNARELARYITSHRSQSGFTTIESLKSLISPIIKGNPAKYLAQLFQALRIEVNEELDALKEFLEQSPACLKDGGRLSVISFHSLEDRLVKTFMKAGMWEVAVNEFGQQTSTPLLKPLSNKPIEPAEEEISANPRSRSARLRVAEKI